MCNHDEREYEVYTVQATGIADGGIGPQYERRYYWLRSRLATSAETSSGACRCAICGQMLRERIDKEAR